MTSVRAFTATRANILTDREEEWNLRLEMVSRAERFLLLTTYYFGSDERSGRMADALAAAARRGVRVVLVIDSFGQRLAQNMIKADEGPRLLARLRAIEAAGGRVVYYAPSSLRHQLVGGGVHVKIQVSEAGIAIFGSSNIAHHSFSQWNEVSLELEGALVAHLLQEACGFARLSAGETAELTSLLPAPLVSGPAYSLRYLREDPAERGGALFPFGTVDNRLTEEIVRLIDGAQRSLCIASLYCKPAPELREAILRACKRGVDVEIFHSHRDSLGVTHLPWIPASIQYDLLLKEGARIYENRTGEHSKVLLADDREVAVGSYNLEHAAHDRLIEAMLFSDDVTMCGSFRALFQTLRRSPDNVALAPGWLSKLPLRLQVERWLYRPLQRWM
jgi:cardiolipin synthase